jgi:hypothetical protein
VVHLVWAEILHITGLDGAADISKGNGHIYRGFLHRLLHDARDNRIALATACMIPLLGLIGNGVDISRTYLTKARMQQA